MQQKEDGGASGAESPRKCAVVARHTCCAASHPHQASCAVLCCAVPSHRLTCARGSGPADLPATAMARAPLVEVRSWEGQGQGGRCIR